MGLMQRTRHRDRYFEAVGLHGHDRIVAARIGRGARLHLHAATARRGVGVLGGNGGLAVTGKHAA